MWLRADHGQQLEFVVAVGSGDRGEDHERLELVGIEEGLPVQFK